MKLVHWSVDYSVKVSTFDEHHQQLFDLINELHEAMLAGESSRVVPMILKRLLDYTRYHFGEEEAAMLRTNYPLYAEHKLQHERLIAQLTNMCQQFERHGGQLSAKLLGVLRNWLRTHILRCDRMYSQHFIDAGMR